MNNITNWRRHLRVAFATLIALASLLPSAVFPALARPGDRTIYLYYIHTKETAKITFKRGGRYDNGGLAQLSQMLRDWRRNEPIKMDPALFDLVWEVYQESGATGPIHVVSAYRSPATNEMLRSRSRGVAKGSRHTTGQALDFFIPGVSIRKLREIAMRKQTGGVGYYPTSNSPFVHLDTGSVRAWPRMTRTQLAKLFPDGRTLHVPNTGVPLSNKGYQLARADWEKCRTVPCNGRSSPRTTTRVASSGNSDTSSPSKPQRTLFDFFFGNDEAEDAKEGNIAVASNNTTRRSVTTTQVSYPPAPTTAPVPLERPHTTPLLIANAPTPAPRPENLDRVSTPNNTAIASIEQNTIPKPRILLSSALNGTNNPGLTAYAPTLPAEPNAKRAVDTIIERRKLRSTDPVQTASVSPNLTQSSLIDIIDSTWTAVSARGAPEMPPVPRSAAVNIATRQFELVAPDLDHVTEIFTDPRAMSSSRYAVIFEPDDADFNPAPELGIYWRKLSFSRAKNTDLTIFSFKTGTTLIVASR